MSTADHFQAQIEQAKDIVNVLERKKVLTKIKLNVKCYHCRKNNNPIEYPGLKEDNLTSIRCPNKQCNKPFAFSYLKNKVTLIAKELLSFYCCSSTCNENGCGHVT